MRDLLTASDDVGDGGKSVDFRLTNAVTDHAVFDAALGKEHVAKARTVDLVVE